MSSSLAPIAETWTENVLPQWQHKIASHKMLLRFAWKWSLNVSDHSCYIPPFPHYIHKNTQLFAGYFMLKNYVFMPSCSEGVGNEP